MEAPLRMMSALPRVLLTAAGFTFSSSITSPCAVSELTVLPPDRPARPRSGTGSVSTPNPPCRLTGGRWLSFSSVLRGRAGSTGLPLVLAGRCGEPLLCRRRRWSGENAPEPAAGRRTSTGLKLASSVCSIEAGAVEAVGARAAVGPVSVVCPAPAADSSSVPLGAVFSRGSEVVSLPVVCLRRGETSLN